MLDHEYFFTLSNNLSQGNLSESLLLLERVVAQGLDLHRMILDWSEFLRNILLFKDEKTKEILQISTEEKQLYQKWQASFHSNFLISALDILNQGEQNFRASHYPRLHIEILLMKISHIQESKKRHRIASFSLSVALILHLLRKRKRFAHLISLLLLR